MAHVGQESFFELGGFFRFFCGALGVALSDQVKLKCHVGQQRANRIKCSLCGSGCFVKSLRFVGEHDRDTRAPVPDHISARHEDLPSLIDGMIAFEKGAQLIVSHHDFARTPPLDALLAIVDRCHAISGAIAKIATAVERPEDRDTLLELLALRPERTCVIGMGASADLRIELAARGSLLAYGYLERATAPGQMSAAETHQRLLAASPSYAARHAQP